MTRRKRLALIAAVASTAAAALIPMLLISGSAEAAVTGMEIVSKSETVPGLGVGTANRPCPAGKKLVGGGYTSTNSNTFHVYASMVDFGWQVNAVNRNKTSRTVTAHALCSGNLATTETNKLVNISGGITITHTQRCPSGKFMVGGTYFKTNFMSGMIINSSRPAAGSEAWTFVATNNSSGSQDVSFGVVCTDKLPEGRQVVRPRLSSAVDVGAVVTANAPCPAGKVVTGGGWDVSPGAGEFEVHDSSWPSSTSQWSVRVNNRTKSIQRVSAIAVCVTAG